MKKKTIDILEHIQRYCQDIEETIDRFGKDQAVFDRDRDYRNSVCMSLLQIGELTSHLSEDFRESTKGTIYWTAIKGMRNLFAHDYGAVDVKRVWETAIADIPALHHFCNETIQIYRSLEQEAAESEFDFGLDLEEDP